MVLQSSQSALPLLVRIFQEYYLISGLRFNIKVQHHEKHFGFILGPSWGDFTYDKPLSKFAQRAKDWSAVGFGLALTTIAYSAHILPVLLSVAQLDSPPASWIQVAKLPVDSFQGQPIGAL